MSRVKAKVSRIQSLESLHIVSFELGSVTLKMMSLNLRESIKVGVEVILNIKPMSVAIGRDLSGELSYSNQIDTKITSIQLGELLCSVKLALGEESLEAMITAESAQRMHLNIGNEVTAFIKANDISIAEVLS